jgi:hypothetical protein
MPEAFAELDLVKPAMTKSGQPVSSVSVRRMLFADFAAIVDEDDMARRLNLFIARTVRAGSLADGAEIDPASLNAADAAELIDVLAAQTAVEAAEVGGDGLDEPIVYTLKHPIKLGGTNGEAGAVVGQIEFQARTLGDVAEFLSATGSQEFRVFMRAFGTILGVEMPITDALIGALDIEDVVTIQGSILGKLARSRGRWRKLS